MKIKSILLAATLSVAGTINLHAETVAQQIGRAQDTIAAVEVARFQQEQADRAAKIADQIRAAALAIQAAKEARDADLEKEIQRCLLAGLPTPTEASWQKPTGAEKEAAKFHATMREQMNERVHQEYSNPSVSKLSELLKAIAQ